VTSQLMPVEVEATNSYGHILQPLVIIASDRGFKLARHIIRDAHLGRFWAVGVHGFWQSHTLPSTLKAILLSSSEPAMSKQAGHMLQSFSTCHFPVRRSLSFVSLASTSLLNLVSTAERTATQWW
jgi:hypothetical protein